MTILTTYKITCGWEVEIIRAYRFEVSNSGDLLFYTILPLGTLNLFKAYAAMNWTKVEEVHE